MDVVLMILYVSILLGFLVLIHEGGHYLASRAFGVRVTEFMIGFPGPGIGFTKWGTKFGVTCVPLGGYAKVCGMEPGEMSPHLEAVLAAAYRRGTANMEDIAQDCDISDDDALAALDELVEWGSLQAPTKKDKFNTYRAPATHPTKKQIKQAEEAGEPAPLSYELGQPRLIDDAHALFGFIAGIAASDHDLSDVFVDSALKICGNDVAAFTEFVEAVNALATKIGFNCVMTSSIALEDVPESLKKYL